MMCKLSKRIKTPSKNRVLFFTLVAFGVLWNVSAIAKDMKCNSLNAIYVPHIPQDFVEKQQYFYEMKIVQTGQDQLKYPTYAFLITQFDKKTGTALTELKLDYGCTIGPPNCLVAYPLGSNDDRYERFDIISLNKDLTQNTINIKSEAYKSYELPYVILFPKLSSTVFGTNWQLPNANVRYLTNERVPPQATDVWKFKECNKADLQ